MTTDLASKLDLAGGTVTGTANVHTLNVTSGALVASGVRTQTPPANLPGVYLGQDAAGSNVGIEIATLNSSASSYIDFTRCGANNIARFICNNSTGVVTMSANGGFSFASPVALTSTLSVLLATTCSALSCTGFTNTGTLTWGGVTYNAPTSSTGGNTYPTLLSIKSDGVTEVGKYLDFHSASAQTAEDFTVRLTASSTSLDCSTAFTSLKHAGTVYRTGAFAVGSVPQILLWNNIKDVTGSVELVPFENVLRSNFAGYYQITVCWQGDTVPFNNVHRTQLRKNGVTVVDTYLWGGGQLICTQKLNAADKLAVFVALPAIGDSFQPISIDQTQTFFSIVQL